MISSLTRLNGCEYKRPELYKPQRTPAPTYSYTAPGTYYVHLPAPSEYRRRRQVLLSCEKQLPTWLPLPVFLRNSRVAMLPWPTFHQAYKACQRVGRLNENDSKVTTKKTKFVCLSPHLIKHMKMRKTPCRERSNSSGVEQVYFAIGA